MSIGSIGTTAEAKKGLRGGDLSWLGGLEPLAVPPQIAWQLLQISNTKGYELIATGELESFLVGRSRRITMASIRSLIERRLAAAKAT
jgi:hypothetical protein